MATELVSELRQRYTRHDGIECSAVSDIHGRPTDPWFPLWDQFWDSYHMPVRWR